MPRRRPSIEHKAKLCTVNEEGPRSWRVESPRGVYSVILSHKGYSCDCMYWSFRGGECSHILAVKRYRGENK